MNPPNRTPDVAPLLEPLEQRLLLSVAGVGVDESTTCPQTTVLLASAAAPAISEDASSLITVGQHDVAGLVEPVPALARTITVPGTYSTITEALRNANDGDTIIIGAGVFGGNEVFPLVVEERVTIRGAGNSAPDATTIWGNPAQDVFKCYGSAGSAVIEGVAVGNGRNGFFLRDGFSGTIRGCTSYDNDRSGILCENSSPTLERVYLLDNGNHGVHSYNSSPTIQDCFMMGNTNAGVSAAAGSTVGVSGTTITMNRHGIWAEQSTATILANEISRNGTGIFSDNSSLTVVNNVIVENQNASGHEGIRLTNASHADIINNTICHNGTAYGMDGAGIYCASGCTATITNCILWGNGIDLSGCSATYSDISDGNPGEGNISRDPLLDEQFRPGEGSPCANAGNSQAVPADVTTDKDGDPRIQGPAVDLGAYESPDTTIPLDLTGATASSYVVDYEGNFGLGGAASLPEIRPEEGRIHQIVNTGAMIFGGHCITAVDAILGEFSVSTNGYYRVTLAGTTQGQIYNTALEGPAAGGGSAFNISLGASVHDMGANTFQEYVSDLGWGSFITDVVAVGTIKAMLSILSAGSGDLLGLVVDLKSQAVPTVAWPPSPPPQEFSMSFEGFLEAGRQYGWSFYARTAAGSASFGLGTRMGLVDMEVSLDQAWLEPIGHPGNSSPRTPGPILPTDSAWIAPGTPLFDWTEYMSGGDSDTQSGYQFRVRCDTDADRIVYDTGFVPDTASSSHTYSPGAYSGHDPVSGCDRISEPLEEGKHYHWHVRYRDSSGDWSDWSSNTMETHQDFYVNTPPTLTTVSTLGGAFENHAFEIPYETLSDAADEQDPDGHTVAFRAEAITNGWLYKGGSKVTLPAYLAPGESFVWHPPPEQNGTLPAFTVVAWDGLAVSSPPRQVSVEVASVNDEPTIGSMMTPEPDPVPLGQDLSLTARHVEDSDGEVVEVIFYRDRNGDEAWDGSDETLGPSVKDGNDWTWTGTTALFPMGPNTYFARARDNEDAWSQPRSTTGTVDPRLAVNWLAAVNDRWDTPANWSLDTSPGPQTVALFDAGAPHQPALYQDESIHGVDFRTAGWTLSCSEHTLSLGEGGIAFAGGGEPTSCVDVGTGHLVFDYGPAASPFAQVASWIACGCSGGAWDGQGITSSAAAAHPQGLTAVGVVDNSDTETGIGDLTTFGGVAVDETSVLARYTWWGDANLDGIVDSNDYDRIDTNWLLRTQEGRLPDGGFRWAVGDFDYDGTIDSNDYDKIDNAWLLSEGAPVAAGTASLASADPLPLVAARAHADLTAAAEVALLAAAEPDPQPADVPGTGLPSLAALATASDDGADESTTALAAEPANRTASVPWLPPTPDSAAEADLAAGGTLLDPLALPALDVRL